jgi:hypothetical protein
VDIFHFGLAQLRVHIIVCTLCVRCVCVRDRDNASSKMAECRKKPNYVCAVLFVPAYTIPLVKQTHIRNLI